MSRYSPHDLLPLPEPKEVDYPDGWFYKHVCKELIPDIIRIMSNGITLDMEKVKELEDTVVNVINEVNEILSKNKYVLQYTESKSKKAQSDYVTEITDKMRDAEFYYTEFKQGDMAHRSMYMYEYCKDNLDILPPMDEILPDVPKWSVKDVKNLLYSHPSLQDLIEKTVSKVDPYAIRAMKTYAELRAELYNKSKDYMDKVSNPKKYVKVGFNPASPDDKHAVLTDMLGFESEKLTDAYIQYEKDCKKAESRGIDISTLKVPKNKYSWNRPNVEMVLNTTDDEDVKELAQALIDYSFSAIIKNNFISAFYKYSIDGTLYGNFKLAGTKTFRLTSNNPNLLNMPSTGSIYAKPLKECLIAPEGYLVYAIDFSALEDRVIASLSRDENKCNIFLENLDGHCLNAYGYFKDKVAEFMDLTGDTTTDVKTFFDLVENGNKDLKAIRQAGKPATFGLSYGAFPPKVASTLKIPINEAEDIFNNYHNTLYPGITDYRENYVAKVTAENGRIHLGMGLYIQSDNVEKDIRTLNNATCQFWSILTLLAINKIHVELDDIEQGHESIRCSATIYDSIYYAVKKDPYVIKWLNDNIVPIMGVDFMENQTVKNEATGEIGTNWSNLVQIPHNASIEEIEEIIKDM